MQPPLNLFIVACMVTAAVVAWPSQQRPQYVEVYTTGTNTPSSDPREATLVLMTNMTLRVTLNPPAEPEIEPEWWPECVEGASEYDCGAAKVVYAQVQAAADALGDRQLGPGGTLPVIMSRDISGSGGYYASGKGSIVLFINRHSSVTAHEMAHAYFGKHFGTSCYLPCDEAEIKMVGVDEGFAKIVAHRVTGFVEPTPPTADTVADILAGSNCSSLDTSASAGKCSHDLGNLVFKAYKTIADDRGADYAYEVYLEAMNLLKGTTINLASLHRTVLDVMLRRDALPPPPSTILVPGPHPFALLDWLRRCWAAGIPIEYPND